MVDDERTEGDSEPCGLCITFRLTCALNKEILGMCAIDLPAALYQVVAGCCG